VQHFKTHPSAFLHPIDMSRLRRGDQTPPSFWRGCVRETSAAMVVLSAQPWAIAELPNVVSSSGNHTYARGGVQ
jgi:hypothetical protein